MIVSLCVRLGSCLQGYFCQGGAMEPAPQSSDNFPKNGPCPVGHYCPAGCLSPVPCPLGSIRNTTGTLSFYIGHEIISLVIICHITVWYSCYILQLEASICIWKRSIWGLLQGLICITVYPHCYPLVIGGVTRESCSACPAGQYCSTEGLANPSGPCVAGFYCPFDFSSTTPYAFLCPKVRVIHVCFHSLSLCTPSATEFPPLSFPITLFLLFSPHYLS